MLVGKILWWDSRDQNGQIKCGDGSKYYFDRSVAKHIKPDRLKAGTVVLFSHNDIVRTCLCARDVKVPNAKRLKVVQKILHEQSQLELWNEDVA